MENFFSKNPINIESRYQNMMSPNKKHGMKDFNLAFTNENLQFKNFSQRRPKCKGTPHFCRIGLDLSLLRVFGYVNGNVRCEIVIS